MLHRPKSLGADFPPRGRVGWSSVRHVESMVCVHYARVRAWFAFVNRTKQLITVSERLVSATSALCVRRQAERQAIIVFSVLCLISVKLRFLGHVKPYSTPQDSCGRSYLSQYSTTKETPFSGSYLLYVPEITRWHFTYAAI